MNRYLLDTNVLIEAKNLHYGFDFCPAFWDWIEIQDEAEKVASVDKVADELFYDKNRELRGTNKKLHDEDELRVWSGWRKASARVHRRRFFLNADAAVIQAHANLQAWASSAKVDDQPYQPKVVAEFLSGADSWLIAHAKAHNWVLVTNENTAPESKGSIKIPDVCANPLVDVRCIDPFEMLSEAGARFVLDLANGV